MTSVCPVTPNAALASAAVCAKVHYILSGTFNTVFLYLLAFTPSNSNNPLRIHRKVLAEGPHQFIGLNSHRDKAYMTTWSLPPSLSAWNVIDGGRDIQKINTVPIRATSSYVQVSPKMPRIYSAGGPTGEVHDIDETTGGFGSKLQELRYVPDEELDTTDKTRKALRYGSHGIDIDPDHRRVFVPHLGHNSIYMYDMKPDGTLNLVKNCTSLTDHDAPRHNVPSRDGSLLYAVTEHNSYVDVYSVQPDFLTHEQRVSVIPHSIDDQRLKFRGDTLRLSQDGRWLYATTRGSARDIRGWLAVYAVRPDGKLEEQPAAQWETPTSGGKANALDTFPFHPSTVTTIEKDWIILTDDQDGYVWVLEWDGQEISIRGEVRLGEDEQGEEEGVGASHAVWLS